MHRSMQIHLPTHADSELILIKKIQFLLGRLGYDAGEVDGEYGKRTKQSLATFTKDTKQSYPAEVSTQQVESLKNVFFQQDLKELVNHTAKKDSKSLNKDSEEELAIIKTIPLKVPKNNSVDAIDSSEN